MPSRSLASGEKVRIAFGSEVRDAVVLEDRGRIGPDGKRIIRVRLGNAVDGVSEFDIPESWMVGRGEQPSVSRKLLRARLRRLIERETTLQVQARLLSPTPDVIQLREDFRSHLKKVAPLIEAFSSVRTASLDDVERLERELSALERRAAANPVRRLTPQTLSETPIADDLRLTEMVRILDAAREEDGLARIKFRVTKPKDAVDAGVDVRDSGGYRLPHDPKDPWSFTTRIGARVSVAFGWRHPPTNRLLTGTRPVRHFVATGDESDKVTVRDNETGMVFEGLGLARANLGIPDALE